MPKKKALRHALRAAIRSWLGSEPPPPRSFRPDSLPRPSLPAIRTELSATVFSADARAWVTYLELPGARRYEPGIRVSVYLQPDTEALSFEPHNEDSRWLAELCDAGFRGLVARLSEKPHVLRALHQLAFANAAARDAELELCLSAALPSDGALESARPDSQGETRLVLSARLARELRHKLESRAASRTNEERLGLLWPLVARLLFALAYPTAPRDPFAARIDVEARLTYVTINALYERRRAGVLVATAAGSAFERHAAAASGTAQGQLYEEHPYFRMLARLGFLLRAEPYASYEEETCIAVREYLDALYLRLSLAGAMPDTVPAMQPMPFGGPGDDFEIAPPEVGRYGVLDGEDLEAWKALAKPLGELGFTPLRQLGIGEFGRVYDVLNEHDSALPARLAIKVDRIVGKKKKAILEAEEAMRVGRHLARLPHVIRLYDTGKLSGKKYTYHVLQLIDGDTLDNLVGVTGREHASVSRPPHARASELEARAEVERALSLRSTELWRRERIAAPFAHALSPAMVLDLLTSVLLWMGEVHGSGYAINDLKNGNLMMNRRGQLKGIDLDSYAPAHSPKDRMTDFMFLAVSLILLLFNAPLARRSGHTPWEDLIESEGKLRAGLARAWPFGNVAALSDGRVTQEEMTDVLVDLVQRSRRLVYTKHPELYDQDVERLITLKRRLLIEELVID